MGNLTVHNHSLKSQSDAEMNEMTTKVFNSFFKNKVESNSESGIKIDTNSLEVGTYSMYDSLGNGKNLVVIFNSSMGNDEYIYDKSTTKGILGNEYKDAYINKTSHMIDGRFKKLSRIASYISHGTANTLLIHIPICIGQCDFFNAVHEDSDWKKHRYFSSENSAQQLEFWQDKIEHDERILRSILEHFKQDILDSFGIIEMNMEKLTEKLANTYRENKTRELEEKKRLYNSLEEDAKHFADELRNRLKKKMLLMKDIENFVLPESEIDKIKKEFEMIASDKKVIRVDYERKNVYDFLVISTTPLIMTSANNSEKTKYLGKCTIKINLSSNGLEILFYSEQKRHGYWSEEDPHPHVGSAGSACLGNASEIMAELISSQEYYALVTVCINFLESFNEEDCAGKNYIYYPDVEYIDGIATPVEIEVEEEDEREAFYCNYCQEYYYEDENTGNYVYDSIEDFQNGNSVLVCNDCADDNYHYDEELEAYLSDDIGEVVMTVDGFYEERNDCTLIYEDLDTYNDSNPSYVLSENLGDYDCYNYGTNIILDGADLTECYRTGELVRVDECTEFVRENGELIHVQNEHVAYYRAENNITEEGEE